MTSDNLPPQIEAAVRLENRLSRIEAAQQAAHASIDNLIGSIGELKGLVLDRFTGFDARSERHDRELEALRDSYNLHIKEVEGIGSRERIKVLEDAVSELRLHRRVEQGHEAGASSVNKRDVAILGVLFTLANVGLKPLIERLWGA